MLPARHAPLIQVLPRFRPGRCGITDAAIQLAQDLQSGFGVSTAFVIPDASAPSDLPDCVTFCDPNELPESCLRVSQGQGGALLVHVSGYGYSADGAPAHLADSLTKVKASGKFRIAAYFHELFASGPPWKSVFWYSRRQKSAVRKIAAQCDLILTNTQSNSNWLQKNRPAESSVPVQLLPVFSTVGEVPERVPLDMRTRAMVVFGLPWTRQRSYKRLFIVRGMLDSLQVSEILDIGAECDVPSAVAGVPVRRMGEMPAPELATLISRTTFGYVQYPAFCIAKSSVFACYCAQGTIPVLGESVPPGTEGLTDGVHLFSPQTAEAAKESALDACSQAAWDWYIAHRIRVHAAQYARWMSESA